MERMRSLLSPADGERMLQLSGQEPPPCPSPVVQLKEEEPECSNIKCQFSFSLAWSWIGEKMKKGTSLHLQLLLSSSSKLESGGGKCRFHHSLSTGLELDGVKGGGKDSISPSSHPFFTKRRISPAWCWVGGSRTLSCVQTCSF